MSSQNYVRVDVREYPDGAVPYHTLEVRPHWNLRDRVTLKVGDVTITVLSRDLIAAVEACKVGRP